MTAPDATPARGDVSLNELALRMQATWQRVDPDSTVTRFPASYTANFADMARDLLAEYAIVPKAERDALAADVARLRKRTHEIQERADKELAKVKDLPYRMIHEMYSDMRKERDALAQRVQDLSNEMSRRFTSDSEIIDNLRKQLEGPSNG